MNTENDEKPAVAPSVLNAGLGMQFKIDCIFGHRELKQLNKFEGGRMVAYGYSISYDKDGKETSRTEPSSLSSLGWSDGSPFTETDYKTLSA